MCTENTVKVGQYVRVWWDDGCFGGSFLYGIVEASGPKTATVRWESGIRNRLPHGHHVLKPVALREGVKL